MMNSARFKAIQQHLTSAAKKVYEAVPIAEMWTISQIVTELQRTGSGMDFRIAAGCVNSLIEAALVTEPKRGHFIRAPIREQIEKTPAVQAGAVIAKVMSLSQTPPATNHPIQQPPAKTMPTPKKQSPIDILSGLSARALQIAESAKRLASDIDSAALQIEEQTQNDAQALDKLRQLQTLLQSINTPATA